MRGVCGLNLTIMRISENESRIRHAIASEVIDVRPVRGGFSLPQKPMPDDAVQLSYLGGVLNVFQTNTTRTAKQSAQLSAAVRQQTYSVDSGALGKKMIQELLMSR